MCAGLALFTSSTLGFAQAVPGGASGAAERPAEEPPDAPKKPTIVPPKLVTFKEAPYPPEAQKAGIQGSVVLKLTIDATGKVTAAEVVESAGNGFDEAAQAAALQFVWEPATRDGKPFAVKINYRYDFTLKPVEPPDAPPPPKPTTGNLSGKLQIAGTRVALAGAEVVVKGPGGKEYRAVTDDKGQWKLEGLPPGTYQVRVSAEGFDPAQNEEIVAVGEATDLTYRLAPRSEGIEINVQGERPPREVTRRTIERREIERIPGTGGDALRSIESLPGVARPPAGAGLLIVRGSSPNDTEVFVDGSGIPLIYHFGGLSSVVPTELLDRIDFYPGNFSSQYGRVQGGIVDVRLRKPNTKCVGDYNKPLPRAEYGCFHGLVQADLIDTRALIEGPIGKNWSFIAAGRRSWIDAWIGPVLEQAGAGVTTAPVYYDFQFVAETQPSSTSRLSLRSYGSNDRLEILIRNPDANEPGVSGNVGLETGFYQFQALYEDQLSPKVSQRSMVSVGRTQLKFGLSSLAFNIDLYPVAMRNEFAFKVARGATLNAGMDFQVAPFDVYVRAPPPPREGEPDPGPFVSRPPLEQRTSSTAWRPGWYLEGELTPTRKLRIVPGARVDYARDTGRMDFSPRINARYDVVSPTDGTISDAEAWANGTRKLRTTIKGGIGLFHQPPQFQETDKVFGTPLLRSNRSLHAAVGFEQEFTRYIELGMEAYYKDYSRQVSSLPNSAGSFGYDNAGFGRGYGLETLLKYKPDQRFFGWLAYTLSRSLRTQRDGEPERLFQYDQTHNLTVLGSYRLGRGWEIGARFRIISGSLYTPNLSAPSLTALYAADAGSYVPIQGNPFSQRLPLFHQLDVRVDKRWQFRTWRLNAYLDVQNAYNNAQVQGFDYNYNFSQRVATSGLPIIPSLGLRGEM